MNIGLTALVVLGLYWTFARLERVLPPYKKLLTTWILMAAVVVGIYHTHSNLMNHFVFATTIELRFLKSIFYQNDLSKFERIHVIHPDRYGISYTTPAVPRYADDFGAATTSFYQDVISLTQIALNESGVGTDNITYPDWGMTFDFIAHDGKKHSMLVSYGTRGEYRGFPENTLLVDMNRLQHFY